MVILKLKMLFFFLLYIDCNRQERQDNTLIGKWPDVSSLWMFCFYFYLYTKCPNENLTLHVTTMLVNKSFPTIFWLYYDNKSLRYCLHLVPLKTQCNTRCIWSKASTFTIKFNIYIFTLVFSIGFPSMVSLAWNIRFINI